MKRSQADRARYKLNQAKLITELSFREYRKLSRSIRKLKELIEKITIEGSEKEFIKNYVDVYKHLDYLIENTQHMNAIMFELSEFHNVSYLQFLLCRVLFHERQHTLVHFREELQYDLPTLQKIVDDMSTFEKELLNILDSRMDNEQGWELDYPEYPDYVNVKNPQSN